MRIGFSTGAVARGDFRLALEMLEPHKLYAIELSALREHELRPLLDAIDSVDLTAYRYISFHAPSQFSTAAEPRVVERLERVAARHWPIIAHPDVTRDVKAWRRLGSFLCFKNMDKRKPIGRTTAELELIFSRFPDARLCIDLGHAWQVDRTMSEARQIIRRFRDRILQIHVSEVNTSSEHVPLSLSTSNAFCKVLEYLPTEAPWIIESVVGSDAAIAREIQFVRHSFRRPQLIGAD